MIRTTRVMTLAFALAATPMGMGCGDDSTGTDAGGDAGMDTSLPDTGPPDTGLPDTGPEVGYVDVTLYTPVELPDEELAAAAFTILAGESDEDLSCTTCHGLTLDRVQNWGDTTNAALDCIDGLDPNLPFEADAILACFANADGNTDFEELSLLATAVPLEWFSRLLEVEHFEEPDTRMADAFQRRFAMPRMPVALLEQAEVDVVLSWVRAGMPNIEDQISAGGTRCVGRIDPEVAAHVTAMETEGWAVLNRDRGIQMYGCEADQTGSECLSDELGPGDRAYASGWAFDGNLRILFETDYASSYWTRSSADGRYIAHGGGTVLNSSVIDLARDVVVPSDGLYDPGFFPDNTGFVMQNVMGGGGGFCPQSVLEGEPTQVLFTEGGCSIFGNVGLYQHVGAVDGGDYWTIFGQFVSDNGGQDRTGALGVDFDIDSRMSFVPIIDEGDGYAPRARVRVAAPFEGDAVLSPSGRLVLSRVHGPGRQQAGFALHQVNATPNGDSYDIDAPVIARYCDRGGKVGFSFDERFVALHRYITDDDAAELGFTDASNPDFAEYREKGGSNIYLLDLLTGDRRRITHMGPGQYALFPHFRSDGWIYFIVRDPFDGVSGEVFVASDAALPPAP